MMTKPWTLMMTMLNRLKERRELAGANCNRADVRWMRTPALTCSEQAAVKMLKAVVSFVIYLVYKYLSTLVL